MDHKAGARDGLSQRKIEGAKTLVSEMLPRHVRDRIAIGAVSKRRGTLRVSLEDLTDVDLRQLCASLRGMRVFVREADPATGGARVDVYLPDASETGRCTALCLALDLALMFVCCVIISCALAVYM
jgi:hypothetical protein